MCRHLAYLGPPVTLSSLVLEPEYSLVRQAYAPRRQEHGRINADGFGVGWYAPAVRIEPARYRRATPMWSDRTFASIAGLIESPAVLGAVRNASPGFPVEETGCAPFTHEGWLFSLNGLVRDFVEGVGEELRAEIPMSLRSTIEGVVDTEVLFLLTLARMKDGEPPGDALGGVVQHVFKRTTGRLNLLMTDGHSIYATACGDSLYVRESGVDGSASVVVASEPFDDSPRWVEVDHGSLVEAAPGQIRMRSLSGIPVT